MGLVFNPSDVQGITGPVAPTAAKASVVRALLAKHGVTAPPPSVVAAPPQPAVVAPPVPGNVPPPPDAPTINVAGDALAAPVNTPPVVAPDVTIKKPGMLDRIGDYLKSDDGRATMMRFAAGAFNGGLGGGLTAATNFADQRRAQEAAAVTEAQKLALAGKQVDNTYNLGLGNLGIKSQEVGETASNDRANQGLRAYEINSTNARANQATGEKRYEHVTPSGDVQTTEAGANYRHDTTSGDTTTQQAGENERAVAANQKDIAVANIGHPAPQNTVHLHYTTTPGLFAAMHGAAVNAVRPSQVRPNMPAAGQPVRVNSDADYAALPSGASFLAPDGSTRVKP